MSDEEELERLKTIRVIRGFRPAERKRYEQLLKKQSMKLMMNLEEEIADKLWYHLGYDIPVDTQTELLQSIMDVINKNHSGQG